MHVQHVSLFCLFGTYLFSRSKLEVDGDGDLVDDAMLPISHSIWRARSSLKSTTLIVPLVAPTPTRARPWLLRMELNREAVFDKRLDVVEIAKKVVQYFDGGLHVIRSDQNSEKLVR